MRPGCNGCHVGTGEGVDGALLAGGREFGQLGRGMIRAANLTPDAATGLGAWTLEAWLARFKAMRGAEHRAVAPGQANTVMHWWQYSYMTDQDLEAMYAYLRTVPAVSNRVVRFEALPGVAMSPNWSDQLASDD